MKTVSPVVWYSSLSSNDDGNGGGEMSTRFRTSRLTAAKTNSCVTYAALSIIKQLDPAIPLKKNTALNYFSHKKLQISFRTRGGKSGLALPQAT